MSEVLPPCFSGQCLKVEEEINQRLCKGIHQTIINAGGASLLEIDQCPFDALFGTLIQSDEPEILDLRSKLGIVGVFQGGLDA